MFVRRALRLALVTVAVGAAGLAVATPASAATATTVPITSHHDSGPVEVHSWQTTLKLDAGTAGVLTDNGVSVAATGDAHAGKGRFTFPIVGGSVDPETLAGTIEHSGGLEFTAGGTTLGVEDFIIDTTAGVLTAQVSGTDTRVPLLDLDLSGASIDKDSKGVTVKHVKATLTADAAAALNATFGVDLFTAGLPIGTAKVVICI